MSGWEEHLEEYRVAVGRLLAAIRSGGGKSCPIDVRARAFADFDFAMRGWEPGEGAVRWKARLESYG